MAQLHRVSSLHSSALHSMNPKPVIMTLGCGIIQINTINKKKHMYSITTVFTQENPRIHSGYRPRYLKIHELFSRQYVFINRVE
jgi:hypothetical protein